MIVRSGSHAVALLGAAAGDAEAGDHLVEDRAARRCRVGALAQQLEEPGCGRHDAHVGRHRLGDDRRELVALGRRDQRLGVVPGHDHGRRRGRRRDARGWPGSPAWPGPSRPRPAARRRGRGRRRRTSGSCSRPVPRGPGGSRSSSPRSPTRSCAASRPTGSARATSLGQLHLALGGRAEARAARGRLADRARRPRGARGRGSAGPTSTPSRRSGCRRRR